MSRARKRDPLRVVFHGQGWHHVPPDGYRFGRGAGASKIHLLTDHPGNQRIAVCFTSTSNSVAAAPESGTGHLCEACRHRLKLAELAWVVDR